MLSSRLSAAQRAAIEALRDASREEVPA